MECGPRVRALPTARQSGNSEPIQNATQTACRNTAGRLRSWGAAVLACPLSESASPAPITPTSDKARAALADFATQPKTATRSARAAVTAVAPYEVARPASQASLCCKPESGRSSASRPCSPTDSATAASPAARTKTIHARRAAPSAIQAAKNAPPAPTKSATYMTTLTAHSAARTLRSARFSGCAAGLRAPIENMSEPPTGCPSAEITRQLSTCVPRRKAGGALIVTVVS